ncbi:MAG: DUF3617 domain-containing protein [Panacagrimonas sp.]
MNKHNVARGAAALLWLLAGNAAAADNWGKPGLWEQTTVSGGISGNKKGRVDFECVTAAERAKFDDKDAVLKEIVSEIGKDCTVKNFKHGSKEISYETTCPTGGMKAKIAFESPTAQRSTITMAYKELAGTEEISSRWVSADCGEHAEEEPEE